MTYRNKGLFVGNKLILEDIGLAHFESSANGNNTFLVREKEGLKDIFNLDSSD